MAFTERLVAAWYAPRLTPLTAALLPLSLMFSAVAAIRRWVYRAGIAHAASLPVPVIVVGSILAGGVGKTPLTRALAAALKNTGWRPGIVSRGYGGSNVRPRAVTPGDDPAEVGDEPLLLAHGFGNGRMLPSGPLREPPSRLDRVDALVRLTTEDEPSPVIDSGRETAMSYEPLPWRNLRQADAIADPAQWRAGALHAVAGIGNPARFFALLHRLGFDPVCHPFPDHYRYARADLAFPDATAILMTEKDAVKCAGFADTRCWYLPVRARIDPALIARVERTIRGRQAA